MLDIKFVIENKEKVKLNLQKRGFKQFELIDELEHLYSESIKLDKEVDVLKNERNIMSKEIGIKKSKGENADDLIQKVKMLPDKIKEYDNKIREFKTKISDNMYSIPNLIDESVPEGKNEEFNKQIKLELEKNVFDFEPLNHWDIGVDLDIFDFERAAKITGSRFVVLKNKGSVLERALINFMLDEHSKAGYEEIMPPFIINSDSLLGTGQLPKFEEDLFKLNNTDYYLVPTAEVPITNLHRNEIIDKDKLPFLYCSFTPCFRAEAGSWGKDTRGIIRQHQFNKIELVKIVKPDASDTELDKLLNNAENILQKLGLHYRIVMLCSGDTGFSASKTYDIEVWMPAQKKYREISSCSNFKDYQARRMNIRYKPDKKSKTEFVHTVNGSGLAVGRTMAAILENFQNADGSVTIPEVLHKYTRFKKINKSK